MTPPRAARAAAGSAWVKLWRRRVSPVKMLARPGLLVAMTLVDLDSAFAMEWRTRLRQALSIQPELTDRQDRASGLRNPKEGARRRRRRALSGHKKTGVLRRRFVLSQ